VLVSETILKLLKNKKMQQLTKAEEQLMEQLETEKAFMKDLLRLSGTKPKRQRLPLY
jgi:hypothetical protein